MKNQANKKYKSRKKLQPLELLLFHVNNMYTYYG